MRSTDRAGRFAHSLCAVWIPEIFDVNPALDNNKDSSKSKNKGDEPQSAYLSLVNLDKKRFKLKCNLCSSKGACIQCSYRRCTSAAHPWCVQKQPKGFTHRIIKGEDEALVWEIFCKAHAKAVTEPVKPKIKSKLSISSFQNESDDEFERENERRISYSQRIKSRGDTKSKLSMSHMNKYVDTTMIQSENEKNINDNDGVSKSIFPIVSLLEWPGQSEGEAVTFPH